MSFGVKRADENQGGEPERTIVEAVTTETVVALAIVAGVFAVFTWKMGLAFTLKTAMGTAHDLILNTVFFLMGVIVLAGAFTSLMSEFGIVSVANRVLSPLMKPLFGLPGAASIGVVATYLSDNPAIMPLGADEGFRADIIIEGKVILELESVQMVGNAHKKQLLTYLRLTGLKLGYLLNFGEALMKDGITRTVNGLEED